MKPHHLVLIAAGALVYLVAFATGAIYMTPPSADAPHGIFEYWLERYQTAWSSGIALLGLWFVVRQLQVTALQHRQQMMFNIEPERRALQDIRAYAKELRPLVERGLKASVLERKTLPSFSPERRELLMGQISPAILHSADRVRVAVNEYNQAISSWLAISNQKAPTEQAKVHLQAILSAIEIQDEMTLERWREMQDLLNIDPDTSRHG